jgi:hypothetical protein
MKIYFSKLSLSHIKVFESSIDVILTSGDNIFVFFDDIEEKNRWEEILCNMLFGNNGVAWYDNESGKLHLKYSNGNRKLHLPEAYRQ